VRGPAADMVYAQHSGLGWASIRYASAAAPAGFFSPTGHDARGWGRHQSATCDPFLTHPRLASRQDAIYGPPSPNGPPAARAVDASELCGLIPWRGRNLKHFQGRSTHEPVRPLSVAITLRTENDTVHTHARNCVFNSDRLRLGSATPPGRKGTLIVMTFYRGGPTRP